MNELGVQKIQLSDSETFTFWFFLDGIEKDVFQAKVRFPNWFLLALKTSHTTKFSSDQNLLFLNVSSAVPGQLWRNVPRWPRGLSWNLSTLYRLFFRTETWKLQTRTIFWYHFRCFERLLFFGHEIASKKRCALIAHAQERQILTPALVLKTAPPKLWKRGNTFFHIRIQTSVKFQLMMVYNNA